MPNNVDNESKAIYPLWILKCMKRFVLWFPEIFRLLPSKEIWASAFWCNSPTKLQIIYQNRIFSSSFTEQVFDLPLVEALGSDKIYNFGNATYHMLKARKGFHKIFFMYYTVKHHDIIVPGFLWIFFITAATPSFLENVIGTPSVGGVVTVNF
jgi:hypothetical protein